jgi:hypothetical protein
VGCKNQMDPYFCVSTVRPALTESSVRQQSVSAPHGGRHCFIAFTVLIACKRHTHVLLSYRILSYRYTKDCLLPALRRRSP